MQRHGEDEHRALAQAAAAALRAVGAQVQVRDEVVEQQQEAHAGEEAQRGRQPGRRPLALGHLYGRDDERPDRGGYHDAGGEAEQQLLHPGPHLAPEEKHKTGPQRGAEEGYEYAYGGVSCFEHASAPFQPDYIMGPCRSTQGKIYFS